MIDIGALSTIPLFSLYSFMPNGLRISSPVFDLLATMFLEILENQNGSASQCHRRQFNVHTEPEITLDLSINDRRKEYDLCQDTFPLMSYRSNQMYQVPTF